MNRAILTLLILVGLLSCSPKISYTFYEPTRADKCGHLYLFENKTFYLKTGLCDRYLTQVNEEYGTFTNVNDSTILLTIDNQPKLITVYLTNSNDIIPQCYATIMSPTDSIKYVLIHAGPYKIKQKKLREMFDGNKAIYKYIAKD